MPSVGRGKTGFNPSVSEGHPHDVPLEIAFLRAFGHADSDLREIARFARRDGVSPDAAFIACGVLSEEQFCRALAEHIGASLLPTEIPFQFNGGSAISAIESGFVPLAENALGLRAAVVPQGAVLRFLLQRAEQGLPCGPIAISSRQRLNALVRRREGHAMARMASSSLEAADPAFTARTGVRPWQLAFGLALAVGAAGFATWAPVSARLLLSAALWTFFAAAIWLRALAQAARAAEPAAPPLESADLPIYTIIVPLYREEAIVSELIRALDAIDYPGGKLDIKIVIERHDTATLSALARRRLPPRYEVVVAPEGFPTTKPRALNIALASARGEIVVVYDAEDRPDPDQLRLAAARFAADPSLDCLQARLTIENHGDSWLSRAFAVEYGVLFDALNPGLAAFDLPLPLGGTSNHFRLRTLRAVGAWDAWNVTEDADLGLRLARLGARVDTLASDTREEAPHELRNWFRQRVRWQKGWIQTLLVHTRQPLRVWRELGARRALAGFLIVGGGALGGLLGPLLAALTLWRTLDLVLAPAATPALWDDVATYVLAFWGAHAVAAPAVAAMRRRGLGPAAGLLVSLPAYYLLICLASWAALFEFALRPFQWNKTAHGRARADLRARPSAPHRAHSRGEVDPRPLSGGA